jgi:PAS domain S-box-containing protein
MAEAGDPNARLTELGAALEAERGRSAQLTAALEESEQHHRAFTDAVQDFAIVLLDDSGHVIRWNQGAERLIGYHPDEVLGQPLALFFTPADCAAGKPERELQTAKAKGSASDDNWIVRKDGTRFWGTGYTSVWKDETGSIRGFVKIFRDLTDRKRLEDALRLHAQELAEANRRKDEFLAMLGHELRNPLAPIRNAVQVLRLRAADAQALAWAQEVVERQVHHMTRLVDDLLDVSRITRGKITLHREPLDLARVVRAAAEDYRVALAEAALTLTVDLPDRPVMVVGDATRLAQVLGNLLHNARKFTDPGGQIRVHLAVDRDRQRVTVMVQDTGIGIEPAMLPRVFDTFAQAEQSLARSRGGLGLGLALVKGLVELHGGEVAATSEGSGRGAAFCFALPLTQIPAPLPTAPAVPAPVGKRLRVLVADDNRDAADSLRMLLESVGHEVRVAYTGPAAVEAARQFRPEVVVGDIGLPVLDGYAVARALRQEPAAAEAHLIALSGYASEGHQSQAHEAGFDLHLTKPVDPEQLLRVLASLSQPTA